MMESVGNVIYIVLQIYICSILYDMLNKEN